MSAHTTTKLDDSIFYVYNAEAGKHRFFRCMGTLPDGQVKAKKIGAGPVVQIAGSTKIGSRDWNLVGVYEYAGEDMDQNSLVLPMDTITGKALFVGGLLLTLPDPVLQET